MKVRDLQILENNMLLKGSQGNLTLLQAPMGAGKTYNTVKYLSARTMTNSGSRAFFITDQKKNIPIELFKTALAETLGYESAEAMPEQKFYSRVAVLYSLQETVANVLASDKNREVPNQICGTTEYDQSIKSLREKYDSLTNDGLKEPYMNLRKAEYDFRQYLKERLTQLAGANGMSAKQAHKQIQIFVRDNKDSETQPVCDWINKYYPTIDLLHRQLFLTTTMKFCLGVTPFFKRAGLSVVNMAILTNSLVVFDEFDSTKGQLLQKIVQDSLNMKDDFVQLFSAVRKGLETVQRDMPSILSDFILKKEEFEKLEQLAQRAEQLEKEYCLRLLYKSDLKTYEDNFVFHFPYLRTASRGYKWWSYLNKNGDGVVLSSKKDQLAAERDLHFYRMLAQVSHLINDFSHHIQRYAKYYQKKENDKRGELDPAITLEDATYTIYSALHFSDKQQKALMNVWNGWGMLKLPKRSKTQVETYHQLQRQGLNFYHFEDKERHALETKISASRIHMTPELFLLGVLKHANVIGLSATAEIPTSLNNYDLAYLKEQLGTHYISGFSLLTEATKKEFNLLERYQRAGIRIKVSQAIINLPSMPLSGLYRQRLGSKRTAQLDSYKMKVLDQRYQQYGQKLSDYERIRYLKLFDSFITFITDQQMVTFLGLQSLLPSEKKAMNTEFIESIFEALQDLFRATGKETVIRIIAKTAQSSVEQQLREALSLPAEQDKRVYLLSAYQTLGAGQNLQHKINLRESSKLVSVALADSDPEDSRRDYADINGIYLGEVTHIFAGVKNFDHLNYDLLLMAVQLEYLLDNGEISRKDYDHYFYQLSHTHVKTGKKANEEGNLPVKQFTETKSFRMAVTRYVLQALGRMDRTFNRAKQIQIIVSPDVLARFSLQGLNEHIVSPEAQALQDYKIKNRINNSIDESRVAGNTYQNLTYQTFIEFKQIKLALQSDQKAADYYQRVRDFYLRYPTISKERLAEVQSGDERLLQYLPGKLTEYRVQRGMRNGSSGQYETGEFVFDTDNHNMTVSAESSGLLSMLRYQGSQRTLAADFKHLGYATNWVQQDYIINPTQYINGYLGVLGEVAGKYIIEDNWSIKLEPIGTLKENELFDYICRSKRLLIDTKNWHATGLTNGVQSRKHVMKKLERFDQEAEEWRVMIVNIISQSNQPNHQAQLINNGRILEVAGLIDEQGQLILSEQDKAMIGGFLNG